MSRGAWGGARQDLLFAEQTAEEQAREQFLKDKLNKERRAKAEAEEARKVDEFGPTPDFDKDGVKHTNLPRANRGKKKKAPAPDGSSGDAVGDADAPPAEAPKRKLKPIDMITGAAALRASAAATAAGVTNVPYGGMVSPPSPTESLQAGATQSGFSQRNRKMSWNPALVGSSGLPMSPGSPGLQSPLLGTTTNSTASDGTLLSPTAAAAASPGRRSVLRSRGTTVAPAPLADGDVIVSPSGLFPMAASEVDNNRSGVPLRAASGVDDSDGASFSSKLGGGGGGGLSVITDASSITFNDAATVGSRFTLAAGDADGASPTRGPRGMKRTVSIGGASSVGFGAGTGGPLAETTGPLAAPSTPTRKGMPRVGSFQESTAASPGLHALVSVWVVCRWHWRPGRGSGLGCLTFKYLVLLLP